MTKEEYYKAPSDKVFNEIKEASIKVWEGYDHADYRNEKIDRIKDIKNIQDNAWYMVAMFDYQNQSKLMTLVSPETALIIEDVIKGV